jgi:DNA-binding transcriptional MerR regulator
MKEMLTIQEVAARTGLSAHTLRYYERVGLLDPVDRAPSGHRRYVEADLAGIEFLNRLRATGMTIRRMQHFAELRRRGEATTTERRVLLEEHRREVEENIRALRTDLRIVTDKIATYRELEQLPIQDERRQT